MEWQFFDGNSDLPGDVVNQEYSFSHDGVGGRVDIIATFENRERLMLCEVKPTTAGDAELEQLLWYVEKWHSDKSEIADEPIGQIKANNVVGVLLATGFFDLEAKLLEKAKELNIYFVEFDFSHADFPFKVFHPSPRTADQSGEEPNTKLKHSRLCTEQDWIGSCKPELVEEFQKWTNCLIEDDPERLSWVTKIYKNGHVAIHYKGEYIAWLYPKSRAHRLDGSYGINGKYTSISWEHDSDVAKPHMQKILREIDDQYKEIIPIGFKWRDQNPRND